jgi:hypothetical protein
VRQLEEESITKYTVTEAVDVFEACRASLPACPLSRCADRPCSLESHLRRRSY